MTALIPKKQHSSRLSEAKKSLGHFSNRGMLRVMPSDTTEEILLETDAIPPPNKKVALLSIFKKKKKKRKTNRRHQKLYPLSCGPSLN